MASPTVAANAYAALARMTSTGGAGKGAETGGGQSFGAVESALAMFSESTRIRPACARRPEVAMLIERAKSFPSLAMIAFP